MSRRCGMVWIPGVLVIFGGLVKPVDAADPMSSRSNIWLPVGWEHFPENYREAVKKVVLSPTITAHSGPEDFVSQPETYRWLLERPDRVSHAWRRLSIGCVPIEMRDDGSFHWEDDKGTCLDWRPVVVTDKGRVWYAEGLAKPGPLLPAIPLRAVAILHHDYGKNERGRPTVEHQVEIYVQTDSTAASLVMRLLGPAAPRLAEQGAKQLLLFFAGIAKYVEAYPKEAPALLAPPKNVTVSDR